MESGVVSIKARWTKPTDECIGKARDVIYPESSATVPLEETKLLAIVRINRIESPYLPPPLFPLPHWLCNDRISSIGT
jgi:hypothetical protein